jgi:transcriptional regulator with XRE-family HTH domain
MSVGLTKATVDAIRNQGRTPSADVLMALSRCDNVSLHWLTDGRGSPYRINLIVSDADGWAILDELFQENSWILYEFTHPTSGVCLVLTQPGEFEIKGRVVSYTIVEIIAGDIGRNTLDRVACAEKDGMQILSAEVSEDEFDRLVSGMMGNYELLGWRNERGLIHTAIKGAPGILDQVEEQRIEYGHNLNNVEKLLIDKFRSLSVPDQKQLLSIAETFVNK